MGFHCNRKTVKKKHRLYGIRISLDKVKTVSKTSRKSSLDVAAGVTQQNIEFLRTGHYGENRTNLNTFFERPDEDLKRLLEECAESPPGGVENA